MNCCTTDKIMFCVILILNRLMMLYEKITTGLNVNAHSNEHIFF